MSLQSYRAGESLFLKAWFHNYMLSANQPDQRKHNEKESTTKLCNNKNQRNTNSSQTHKNLWKNWILNFKEVISTIMYLCPRCKKNSSSMLKLSNRFVKNQMIIKNTRCPKLYFMRNQWMTKKSIDYLGNYINRIIWWLKRAQEFTMDISFIFHKTKRHFSCLKLRTPLSF